MSTTEPAPEHERERPLEPVPDDDDRRDEAPDEAPAAPVEPQPEADPEAPGDRVDEDDGGD